MAESLEVPPARAGLFAYDDGFGRVVHVDSFQVLFRLQERAPGRDIEALDSLFRVIAGAAAADGGQAGGAVLDAVAQLLPLVDHAFRLAPLDGATGAGLTSHERVALLASFLASLAPDGPGEADDPAEGGRPVEADGTEGPDRVAPEAA